MSDWIRQLNCLHIAWRRFNRSLNIRKRHDLKTHVSGHFGAALSLNDNWGLCCRHVRLETHYAIQQSLAWSVGKADYVYISFKQYKNKQPPASWNHDDESWGNSSCLSVKSIKFALSLRLREDNKTVINYWYCNSMEGFSRIDNSFYDSILCMNYLRHGNLFRKQFFGAGDNNNLALMHVHGINRRGFISPQKKDHPL